ncbi:MAG: cupin domain-containing protein [Alphaproteobacteria bacterium]|mgnify:FL=1|jgi:quercetin dioxygenase-like cupin family protein|nr:cupin domain-containing protein [Alphaproteobacteria bacterium]MDP6588607.1 cupin domain-containing protein [Alphaproteobacteria bacterium]MDP6819220.1 cupin domain-containing protein [Alphaproteobacteria bacterium]
MAIRVFHRDKPDLMLPIISKDARLVVWPGVGAHTANMNYVKMEPDEANVPHIHAESEDTIYILEGKGTVADMSNGAKLDFTAGQVIHVPVGLRHAVAADKGSPVVSVGGPCPADKGLLRAVGALPKDE